MEVKNDVLVSGGIDTNIGSEKKSSVQGHREKTKGLIDNALIEDMGLTGIPISTISSAILLIVGLNGEDQIKEIYYTKPTIHKSIGMLSVQYKLKEGEDIHNHYIPDQQIKEVTGNSIVPSV